jgi:hypothetical protein
MARVAFPLVAQSPSSGSGLVGAQATITQHVIGGPFGSGAAATIYTSETGAGAVGGNTITTDSFGRWTQGAGAAFAPYWLNEGTYDITITGAGLTTYNITRELFSGSHGAGIGLFTPATVGSNQTAVIGQNHLCAPSVTLTLPIPSLGAVLRVTPNTSVTGVSPVTVQRSGSAVINGVGLSGATSFQLGTPGAYVELQCLDGTNWTIVGGQQDTGWVTIGLATNWINIGGYVPAYRVVSNMGYLSGQLYNNTGGNSTSPFASALPSVARPASVAEGSTVVISTPVSAQAYQITTGGVFSFSPTVANTGQIALDGISYRLS